jgi:Fis family transcriptional regulator
LSKKDKSHHDTCLGDQVKVAIQNYFDELDGEQPCGVYSLVLSQIEKPLLEVVMEISEKNQSKASKILGINRNTLRKKLDAYDLG